MSFSFNHKGKNMHKLLKSLVVTTALAASSLVIAAPQQATTLKNFTPAQRQELNAYMHQYIMDNPQIIVQAVQKLQLQAQMKRVEQGRQGVIKNIKELTQDKYSPAINKGPVTVVEFFDYQCSVCHMMFPIVDKFVKQHPNVRVVFKEFAIFGPASQFAAKASIAARLQGQAKFLAFHNALFKSGLMEGKLKDTDVLRIAKKAGLNIAKLKKDMSSPKVAAEIKATYKLAHDMQLQGTPAFVVLPTNPNDKADLKNITFIPGATQPGSLDKAVAKLQKS
jgi:protein-disulfide isomerase